jgi:hypothetical protein
MFKNKNKFICPISMIVHSVEADVVQQLSLSLKIVRGPQTDESEKFEIDGSKKNVKLNLSFSRDSGFIWLPRLNRWEAKWCTIQLGYYEFNKWTLTGTVDIDMAPMVDQGYVTKVYDLKEQIATENAKVEVTFNISSGKDHNTAQADFFHGLAHKMVMRQTDSDKLKADADN